MNEQVLDSWWTSLDYESKWAVACMVAVHPQEFEVVLRERRADVSTTSQ